MCGLGGLFSSLGFAAAGSSTTGAGFGGLTLPLEVTTRLGLSGGASAAGAAAGGAGSTTGAGSVGDGSSAATGASAAGATGDAVGRNRRVGSRLDDRLGGGAADSSASSFFGGGFFDETALAAGFLVGAASCSGWASRIRPSRSAFRRTRSAWASTMLEE